MTWRKAVIFKDKKGINLLLAQNEDHYLKRQINAVHAFLCDTVLKFIKFYLVYNQAENYFCFYNFSK